MSGEVLIDTSVWRRFLVNDPATDALQELLVDNVVVMHPWVFGELLLGGLSTAAIDLLEELPALKPLAHEDVLALVQEVRLARRGVGWVDTKLLASALVEGAELWTLDKHLAQAASDLGIRFAPA